MAQSRKFSLEAQSRKFSLEAQSKEFSFLVMTWQLPLWREATPIVLNLNQVCESTRINAIDNLSLEGF